ncbi:hypothetical protein FKM82_002019 [Ascaphus truei]
MEFIFPSAYQNLRCLGLQIQGANIRYDKLFPVERLTNKLLRMHLAKCGISSYKSVYCIGVLFFMAALFRLSKKKKKIL